MQTAIFNFSFCLKRILIFCYGLIYFRCHGMMYLTDYDIVQERSNLVIPVENVYIKNASFVTGRAYRRAPYTTNATIEVLTMASKEVSIEITLYEKRNKQYDRSVLTKTMNLCDFLEKDLIFMPAFRLFGNFPKKCPLKPMTIKVINLDINTSPPKPPMMMPIQCRANVEIFFTGTEKRFTILEWYIRVVQRVPKIGKN